MATQYSFVTHWKINASVEQVWNAIYNSTDWSNWWKGVIGVNEINVGDENGIGSVREYSWKGVLPYRLTFSVNLTKNELYKTLSGTAFGELEGIGTWIFKEKEGVTFVTFNWDISTNKPWMNYLSFILKPAFQYNHNIVMKWGEECLKKKLER